MGDPGCGSEPAAAGERHGPPDGPGADAPEGPLPTLPSPTLASIAMDKLVFGAFGDVRPNDPDDTAGYPDAIVRSIFAGLTAKGVSLTVDAGDHCFQSTTSGGGPCHAQFGRFMAGKTENYAGMLLPTMGNHEGCGAYAATSANCTRWASGLVHDFLRDIVLPSTGQSAFPYYSLLAHGTWGTAKFVVVAANAWTDAQRVWLAGTLDVRTTYAFVIRHEPSSDPRAPGVTPSELLLSSHHRLGTLTLSITGHTHLVQLPGGTRPYGDPAYGATREYETIIGNGGAPLDAGFYYGFVIFGRRAADGAIVGQAYEAMAADGVTALGDAADGAFRFSVNADGTPNADTSLP
ncbi:MAG TPA: hypothetical protein VH044_15995 [Polyangiaceae bacterium]|nr:hypothetical protein [Polyangiaceae bacterium]